jgi:hypothetical protein
VSVFLNKTITKIGQKSNQDDELRPVFISTNYDNGNLCGGILTVLELFVDAAKSHPRSAKKVYAEIINIA